MFYLLPPSMEWNNIYFISASNPLLTQYFSVLFLTKKVLQTFWKSKVRGNSYSWKHTRISSNPTQRMNKKTELFKKFTESFSKTRKCSVIFRSHVNKYPRIPPEEPHEVLCYPPHSILLNILILWGQWEHTPEDHSAEGPERNGIYIPYSLCEEQWIMRSPSLRKE